jgi:predicted RNA-binding Zn-ribbon protein involved in translation (DUF1610 family)
MSDITDTADHDHDDRPPSATSGAEIPHAPHGCPSCGSERLRHVEDASDRLARFAGKRHYRCSACGWSGWKHRLKRRHRAATPRAERPQITRKQVIFLLICLAVVIAWYIVQSSGPPKAQPDMNIIPVGPRG